MASIAFNGAAVLQPVRTCLSPPVITEAVRS